MKVEHHQSLEEADYLTLVIKLQLDPYLEEAQLAPYFIATLSYQELLLLQDHKVYFQLAVYSEELIQQVAVYLGIQLVEVSLEHLQQELHFSVQELHCLVDKIVYLRVMARNKRVKEKMMEMMMKMLVKEEIVLPPINQTALYRQSHPNLKLNQSQLKKVHMRRSLTIK